MLLSAAISFTFCSFAAAPDGAVTTWDATTRTATITLPAKNYTVDSDLWLTDEMSEVASLRFIGAGASVKFSESSYSTGLLKLAANAVIHAGFGVTIVANLGSTVGKGFFTNRSDVGIDLAEGSTLAFDAAADATKMLYTGNGGLTLTGASVKDNRLGAYSSGVLSDRTEGLDNLLHVDGTIFVKASATPSVISSPCLMISAGTVFDVESGATLKIDAPAQDEWVAAGTPRRFGGFCKLGDGELVLASDCELTGRVVVKDGVLRLGAGVRASATDWEIYDGAKVVLSDGSLLTGRGVKTVPAVMRRAQIHLDASVFNGGDASAAKNHLYTIRNIGSAGGVFTQFNNSRMNFELNGFADGKPAFLFNQQPYVLEGFKNTSRDVTVFMVRRNFQGYRSPFNFVNMSYLRENPELTRQTAGFYNSASFGVSHNSTTSSSVNLWSANKGTSGNNELANRGFTSTAPTQTDPLIEMFAQWGRKNEDRSDLVVRQFAASAENLVTTDAQTIDTSVYPGNALNHDYLAIGMRVFSSSSAYKLEVVNNDGNYGEQNFNLAEFIAFFERPTEAELTEITDYLRAKWFDVTIETAAPLTVEIGADATASVDEAPARAVEKTGDGTLCVSSVGAAAQDSLSVQEGTLAFGPATLAAKAAVWLDPSDEAALTKNANNSVKAVKNKGTLGGDFKVNHATGWSDAYLGEAYSAAPKMLQLGGSSSFDLVAPLFPEASDDPVTVFLVMAVNREQIVEWRRIFSFMSPTNEVAGTSNLPPELMDLMLSRSANITSGKPFAYQVKTEGSSSAVVDRSVYSKTSWTEDTDYGKPILVALEDYPSRFNYALATATDSVNLNGSDNTRHSHRYGVLRLGATAVAGGGASACFHGGIGEMIVFNKPLTVAEKTAVTDYLAARWFSGDEAAAPVAVAGGSQSGRMAKADLVLADGVTVRPAEEGPVTVGALSLAENASVSLALANPPTDGSGVNIFRFDSFNNNGGQFVLDESLASKWRVNTTAPFVSVAKRTGIILIVR